MGEGFDLCGYIFDMPLHEFFVAQAGKVIGAVRFWVGQGTIAFFLPVVFSLSTDFYVWWLEYSGILFHLAMFMLVPSLKAPEWARAAGYGWLLLDTTVGVLALHGVDPVIIDTIRLGGHIFAGIWIVPAALAGSLPSKIFGGFAGAALFLYTFCRRFYRWRPWRRRQ